MPHPEHRSNQPALTKAELAALDLFIAHLQERGESAFIPTSGWDDIVNYIEGVVREAWEEAIGKEGGPGPQARLHISESQKSELNRQLRETILGNPTLEQLLALRNSFGRQD